MTETMRTFDGNSGWREPLDRLAVHTILISPDTALASLLRSDGEWQRVYEDDQAVIFTKAQNALTTSVNDNNAGVDETSRAEAMSARR